MLFTGCGKKRAKLPTTNIDSVTFTSLTENVETLISDSGITKYKLKANLWYTYEEPEQMWKFPEGIYLEQFDTLFNIIASIQADTAYYYQSRNLWELKNNVRVMNHEGQQFYAVTLYWDERNEEIYSHDPIRIIRKEGEMLESQYGFRSNQMMTKYELYSSRGHLNVKDDPMVVDSVSNTSENKGDSIHSSTMQRKAFTSTINTDSIRKDSIPKDHTNLP